MITTISATTVDSTLERFSDHAQTELFGLGAVTLTDAALLYRGNGGWRLTVQYSIGGTLYGCVAGTAQELDNWLLSNPLSKVAFLLAASEQDTRRIPAARALLLYTRQSGVLTGRMIARAINALPAGGSGNIAPVQSNGSALGAGNYLQATNRSSNLAPAGAYGFASQDADGAWSFYPSCC